MKALKTQNSSKPVNGSDSSAEATEMKADKKPGLIRRYLSTYKFIFIGNPGVEFKLKVIPDILKFNKSDKNKSDSIEKNIELSEFEVRYQRLGMIQNLATVVLIIAIILIPLQSNFVATFNCVLSAITIFLCHFSVSFRAWVARMVYLRKTNSVASIKDEFTTKDFFRICIRSPQQFFYQPLRKQ